LFDDRIAGTGRQNKQYMVLNGLQIATYGIFSREDKRGSTSTAGGIPDNKKTLTLNNSIANCDIRLYSIGLILRFRFFNSERKEVGDSRRKINQNQLGIMFLLGYN